MSEKFKDLSVDEGTRIIAHYETKLGEYEVVYEKWYWNGIYAESIIFFNEDIAHLNENQVKNLISEETALLKENSKMTYKKGDTHTFVNFNFVTE